MAKNNIAFQGMTADAIVDFLEKENHSAYILADETGLGKTITTRRVIAEMSKKIPAEQKTFVVLYVASNLTLAKDNIEKLNGRANSLGTVHNNSTDDRLSSLSPYDFMKLQDGIHLYSITPDVSLYLTKGKGKNIEKCEEFFLLCEMIKNKKIKITDTSYKYIKIFKQKNKKSLDQKDKELIDRFVAWINNNDDIQELIDRITIIRRLTDRAYNGRRSEELKKLEKDNKIHFDRKKDLDTLRNYYTEKNKEITEDELNNKLNIYYYSQEKGFLQLLMSLYVLSEMKPNLVILDEIQNYPDLFKRAAYENKNKFENKPMSLRENTHFIINAVTGKGKKKQKVLMLSATPYKNYAEIYEDEPEKDTDDNSFNKEISDMAAIANYLSEKNENNDTHRKLLSTFSDEFKKIANECIENGIVTDVDIDDLLGNAELISKKLKSLGISRIERPRSDYLPDKEYDRLEPDETSISEILNCFVDKLGNSKAQRKFLSLPVYGYDEKGPLKAYLEDEFGKDTKDQFIEVDKNARSDKPYLRTRTKKLLHELFGQEGELPLLFIPPTKPSHDLKGHFKNKEGKSKMIFFSLYTCIPDMMKLVVTKHYDKIISDKYNSLGAKDPPLSEEIQKLKDDIIKKHSYHDNSDSGFQTIDHFLDSLKKRDQTDSIKLSLYKKLLTKDAVRIVYLYYLEELKDNSSLKWPEAEENLSDYLKIADHYFDSGCIEDVLNEFFYLIGDEHDLQSNEVDYSIIKQYLGINSSFALPFSSVYTSKFIHRNNLENYYRPFRSPFYPFCFFMTSVAQEGFDFHWYCDTIVHWNCPSSPITLIQREGRINRYNCYALRKALLKDCKEYIPEKFSWDYFFTVPEAEENPIHKAYDRSPAAVAGMFPHFISYKLPEEGEQMRSAEPLSIKRMCMYYLLSEEDIRWRELMKLVELYRSMFGAAKNDFTDRFLSLCEDNKICIDKRAFLADISINLMPDNIKDLYRP